MDPITANAFFDELQKISQQGSGIGKLIFPSAEDEVDKREDRSTNVHTVTGTSPNPEERAPHPQEQYA